MQKTFAGVFRPIPSNCLAKLRSIQIFTKTNTISYHAFESRLCFPIRKSIWCYHFLVTQMSCHCGGEEPSQTQYCGVVFKLSSTSADAIMSSGCSQFKYKSFSQASLQHVRCLRLAFYSKYEMSLKKPINCDYNW